MAEAINRGFSGGHQAGTSTPGTQRRKEEAAGVVGTVVEGAENVASSVGSAAGQAWDATKHGAQKAATAVADAAETAWDSTTGFMRRYPFATLAIGFGLGFMVCLALRNRS